MAGEIRAVKPADLQVLGGSGRFRPTQGDYAFDWPVTIINLIRLNKIIELGHLASLIVNKPPEDPP